MDANGRARTLVIILVDETSSDRIIWILYGQVGRKFDLTIGSLDKQGCIHRNRSMRASTGVLKLRVHDRHIPMPLTLEVAMGEEAAEAC